MTANAKRDGQADQGGAGLDGDDRAAESWRRLRALLDQALRDALASGGSCAYLCISIDGLARVVAAQGPAPAEAVVHGVEQVLGLSLRARDSMGRIGEDRFGVVLYDCDDGAMAATATKLLCSVRERAPNAGLWAGPVSLSIGGTALPAATRAAREAMAGAEQAIAVALRTGGARFVPFRPATTPAATVSMAPPDLLSALIRGRLRLALRSVTDGGDTVLGACRAGLIDWRGRPIDCGDPDAARYRLASLLLQVGRHNGARFVLNLGAPGTDEPSWRQALVRLLSAQGELAGRLEVEIPHTLAARDLAVHESFVRDLVDTGCRVTLQRYGLGADAFARGAEAAATRIDEALLRRLALTETGIGSAALVVGLASAYGLGVLVLGEGIV